MLPLARILLLALVALGISACASVDPGRFGVDAIEFEGNDKLDDKAIEACLITRERETFGLTLGLASLECGKPPFDSSPPTLRLWRWPWTQWPAFNEAVFDADIKRVERFYQARGYYDARVVDVQVTPPEARRPDEIGECDPSVEHCEVALLIVVDEGLPTRVTTMEVVGLDTVDPKTAEELRAAIPVRPGDIIDESVFNRGKKVLLERLQEAGYAGAEVEGHVAVNTAEHSARVEFRVKSGPVYTIGNVTVRGQGQLSEAVILGAAGVERGTRYDPQLLKSAQAEVFALGAFSAVVVHETLRESKAEADLELEVSPLPPDAFRVSVGVMSGAVQRSSTSELVSVPQWDTHLSTSYERRHVFGSLGRLRIEERPRLVFSKDFPRLTTPRLSNVVKLALNQPGLLERRTDAFFETAWDYGPEPFLQFLRSDIFFRVGVRRAFAKRKLQATVAVQQDLFVVDPDPGNVSSDGQPQVSYGYSFLETDLRYDLRDNSLRPSKGAYFGVNATQSVRWQESDWAAFRFAPEVRAYLPLFWDVVWANRVLLGSIYVLSASDRLDPVAQALGPTTYRLRGGGANSNRGFLAGTLGAGLTGGIRRWEASSEVRVPIGGSFVLAGFFDVGDVNDAASFRFDELNATAGWGLRFYTVLGAIRLDVGYRLAHLQRLDGSTTVTSDSERLPFTSLPGAVHLTLGDAF